MTREGLRGDLTIALHWAVAFVLIQVGGWLADTMNLGSDDAELPVDDEFDSRDHGTFLPPLS